MFREEAETIRQQLAEREKDAERYRWLLEMPNADLLEIYCCGTDLDRVCDAAIAAAPKGEKE